LHGSRGRVSAALTLRSALIIDVTKAASGSPPLSFHTHDGASAGTPSFATPEIRMANTKSAKKATRRILRQTEINKSRRSRMRSTVRKVEEAITAGNRETALAALRQAEPVLMRAAQKGVLHKHAASRKVARLTHRIAQLGQ
jgi:small subunit ribosomal protein S20